MSDLRSVLLYVVLAATLAACGGQCGSTSSSAGNQHLVFTGPAAGTLTDAKTLCTVYAGQGQSNYHLDGTLSGLALALNIQIHAGYKGPGTYQVGSLLDGSGEVRLQVGSYVGSTATGAGTVTINPDGKSGSLDADLSGGEHVKGTFRCDEVQTS